MEDTKILGQINDSLQNLLFQLGFLYDEIQEVNKNLKELIEQNSENSQK